MTDSKTNIAVLIIALLVIIVCGSCISGISAYFMAAARVDNNASAGSSEISVEEVFSNPDIEPDSVTEITKQVKIRNTGADPSAIRVKIVFSAGDIEKKDPSDQTGWAIVDYNTADWEKENGYWYYKAPLDPDEVTEPLFNNITCVNPTTAQIEDFDVYVYAESRNCSEKSSLTQIKKLF